MADGGLHYLEYNPAGRETVVLLHGLGVTGDSWQMQVPALQQAGFRVVVPDLPGFGASTVQVLPWRVHTVAAYLDHFLNGVCPNPVHLVGISMGGAVAIQIGLSFPGQLQSLVLVNTFARIRPKGVKNRLYLLQRLYLLATGGLPSQAEFVAQRLFPRADQEMYRWALVDQILQSDGRAYRSALVGLGLFNVQSRLKDIHTRTLVVTGADDATVSPEFQAHLAHAIPGARHVVIQDAGHAVIVDQAEAFNQALVGFLTAAGGLQVS
jgi:3-oxoadipate enol-lactonase